jgi:hypothetical protein
MESFQEIDHARWGGGEGQEFIKRTAKDWEGERKVQGSWKRWATRNSECRGANEGRGNRQRKKGTGMLGVEEVLTGKKGQEKSNG